MSEIVSEEKIIKGYKQLDLPLSLGQMLREKRTKKGISVEDIADHLRVSSSVIKDIESDAYPVEEMTIFVRGYIRNYAKLVDLTLKEVNQAFLHLGLKVRSAKAKPIKFSTRPRKKRIVRFVTYFIIIMLIVLVVVWRYSYHVSDNNIVAASSVSSVEQDQSFTSSNVILNKDISVQKIEARQPATPNPKSVLMQLRAEKLLSNNKAGAVQ